MEERKHGIRACALMPGGTDTPFLDPRLYPAGGAFRATLLQPEDIAAAVLFVAALPQRATVEELLIQPTIRPGARPDQPSATSAAAR